MGGLSSTPNVQRGLMDIRILVLTALAACLSLGDGLLGANVHVAPNGQTFNSPEGMEVAVSNWPSDSTALNGALRARNRSQRDGELEIEVKAMGRPFYEKRLSVPAGKGVRADVFLPLNEDFNYGQANIRLRNSSFNEMWTSLSSSYRSSSSDIPLYRPMKPEALEGVTWRRLCNLTTLRLESRLWLGLPEADRTAILEWVDLGGNLEIEGESALLDAICAARPPLCFSEPDGKSRYGRGHLRVSEKFASDSGQRTPLEEYEDFNPSPSWEVVAMKPQVFIPALVIFGLLIGPGTIFWCRRRGRPALALLLIPAISAVSCMALLALSLVSDGVRPKVCRQSVAYLDQAGGKAYVQELLGVEAPMGLGSPVDFPEDAIVVIPQNASEMSRGHCVAAGGRLLLSSFALPRIPTFFGMAKYESRRERLEVREGAESLSVTNGLGSGVRKLLLRDSKGRFWGSDFVQAGQEAELSPCVPKEQYGGFHLLKLNEPSLKREAPLARRCYQAYLDSDVFGERGIGSDRAVGDNFNLLVGKY